MSRPSRHLRLYLLLSSDNSFYILFSFACLLIVIRLPSIPLPPSLSPIFIYLASLALFLILSGQCIGFVICSVHNFLPTAATKTEPGSRAGSHAEPETRPAHRHRPASRRALLPTSISLLGSGRVYPRRCVLARSDLAAGRADLTCRSGHSADYRAGPLGSRSRALAARQVF